MVVNAVESDGGVFAWLPRFDLRVLVAPLRDVQRRAARWRSSRASTHRTGRHPPASKLRPLEHENAVVNGTVLRAVRTEELIARARAQLMDMPEVHDAAAQLGLQVVTDEEKALAESAAALASDHERELGRTGYPESHYRHVALDYLELYHEGRGMTRGIRQELAGRYGVSDKTVGDWIHRAHELGFLGLGARAKQVARQARGCSPSRRPAAPSAERPNLCERRSRMRGSRARRSRASRDSATRSRS